MNTRTATILGVSMFLTALTLVCGLKWAFASAADRVASAINTHAAAVRDAGYNVGPPISRSIGELNEHVDRHAAVLREPRLTFVNPVAVQQPVTIQGPHQDGALPVHALIGK
jgi:hypothetical protein